MEIKFENGLAAYNQDRKTLEAALQQLDYAKRQFEKEIARRYDDDRFAWAVRGKGGNWIGHVDFSEAVEAVQAYWNTLGDKGEAEAAPYRLVKVYLSADTGGGPA